MNKGFLIFLFSLGVCVSLKSQIIVVKDKDTKKGIPFVNVYDLEKTQLTNGNYSGKVSLTEFAKKDSVVISSINYYSQYISLSNLDSVIFLTRKDYAVPEIVVSATKWNQKLEDVPTLIRKVNVKQIELRNPQTAADMLGGADGVFIQKSQQGGGSPMIRGFSSNRLLYSIDGVRMNNAIFRSGNLHNVISLDVNALESTEVLFGPGSVIYGSDAIGGVMNFTSLKPHFADSDTFKLQKGSYLARVASANKEFTSHLDFNLANNKWSSLSSITFSNYLSAIMGNHGPNEYLNETFATSNDGIDYVAVAANPKKQYPSGYNQLNITQKLARQLKDSLLLSYSFHFSESSDVPRYDRLIQELDGKPRFAEWYYGPQKWVMHQISFVNTKTSSFYDEAKAHIAFQQFVESRQNRRFNSSIKNNNTERVNAYSVNLDFLKSFSKRNTITYGLEAINNQVTSEGNQINIITNLKTETVSRHPNSSWTSIAAFFTNQYKLNQRLNINLGLRFNSFNLKSDFDTSLFQYPVTSSKINNNAFSGSLGFLYSIKSNQTLYTNFSTGFRAPNVDDIGKVFDSEPGSVTIPNTDLSAEQVFNYEFGYNHLINDIVKFQFNIYYTHLNNAMLRRDFSFNGLDTIFYQGELSRVQAIQNAAKSYVYGFQTSVEIKLNSLFNFRSSFNYQKGEEEVEDGSTSASRHVAPVFGMGEIIFKKQSFESIFYANYSGKISSDNLNIGEQNKPHLYATNSKGMPYSPAWYTLNFRFNYTLKRGFLLSGGIENITSQRYRTYSSGVTALGRNFIASIKYKF